MSKVFFLGFFMHVASTIAFIVSILTPFWIIKTAPSYRGIFEACDIDQTNSFLRRCGYIFIYADNKFVADYRTDYAIACASLAVAGSSLAIIIIWISGIHMCLKGRVNDNKGLRLRTSEILIMGTLLVDCITVVIWVVMLAKNLDNNGLITTNQIGWSLWLAVGSTGGFLIALILFCIHRIDLGASFGKRSSNYNESREYLQRF